MTIVDIAWGGISCGLASWVARDIFANLREGVGLAALVEARGRGRASNAIEH